LIKLNLLKTNISLIFTKKCFIVYTKPKIEIYKHAFIDLNDIFQSG